jgi:hypothetical protein
MLAMGHKVLGSNLVEDGGFLWVTKIHNVCFLQRGSKAIVDLLHAKEPYEA